MVAALALCLSAAHGVVPPRGRGPAHAASARTLRDLPRDQHVVVWTPADVAAWSGPGLRDGQVVDIETSPSGVWVMTDRGGPAMWNGQSWLHIDRRDGIAATHWRDLALQRSTRWFAHDRGATRVLADGTHTTWSVADGLPLGGVFAVHPVDDDDAWLATDDGIWRTSGQEVLPVLQGEPCHALIDDGIGGLVGACEPEKYALPAATPYLSLPRNLLRPAALLPTRDGAWIASYEGLFRREGTEVTPIWSVEGGLHDLVRLDQGMLLAAGAHGAWIKDEEGRRALRPEGGILGTSAWSTAAHPHPQKAWLGTDHGLALVTSAGTATPLPVAPLAVHVEVRDIEPHGAEAAVATDRGVHWLGRHAPRGWSNLSVATGPDALDVLRAPDGSWWVVTPQAAFRLDRRGRLSRWPTQAREALSRAGAVGLRAPEGIRWWAEGARMLSPQESIRATRASTGPDDTLWTWHDHTLTAHRGGEQQSWAVPDVAGLVAVNGAAWVATATGLFSVRVGGRPTQVFNEDLGALSHIAMAGSRLWVGTATGQIYVTEGQKLQQVEWDVLEQGPRIRSMHPDDRGLWLSTDAGIYRVLLR